MEAIKFKNWTNEEFKWKWNGVEHVFPVGMEIYMEADKAYHFAKHLVDRELNKLNIPTNMDSKRAELGAKCFPVAEAVTPEVAIDINEKSKKKSVKKVAEEFPDLNNK